MLPLFTHILKYDGRPSFVHIKAAASLHMILLSLLFPIRCWTLSRTTSFEITLVHLSGCLSVRPSLNYLKIGSLGFSDILHNGSWPQYLVTNEARFLKKIGGQSSGPISLNQAQNEIFRHFLGFGSYVFLKLHACNNV